MNITNPFDNLTKEEEAALYESGLSADSCLGKLDTFAREAIVRYGRILMKNLNDSYKEGFEGGCYCCETVALNNKELHKKLEKITNKVFKN